MQILKKMRANERKITQAAKDFTKINWPKGFSEGGWVMEIYMKSVKVCGGRNFWLSQQ